MLLGVTRCYQVLLGVTKCYLVTFHLACDGFRDGVFLFSDRSTSSDLLDRLRLH